MLQDRLNGLATCCIEKDILDSINVDSVLDDFASRNARRSFFSKHSSLIVDGLIGGYVLFEVFTSTEY